MATTQDYQYKIQLSLSALLFFAPFVAYSLSHKSVVLSDEDRLFVQGYVRVGYVTILLLLCAVTFGIIEYMYTSDVIYWFSTLSTIALLVVVIAGCVGIFANISLIRQQSTQTQSNLIGSDVQGDRSQIFLHFLPIYNFYRRYLVGSFQRPYRWVKESLLWWSICIILGLFTSDVRILSLWIVCIIVRCVMLMGGVDVMSNTLKQRLHKLFVVHPEEMRGYVVGWVMYMFRGKQEQQKPVDTYIQHYKTVYQQTYTFQMQACRREYGIAVAYLFFRLLYGGMMHWQGMSWMQIIPGILLVGRYLIVAYISGGLPVLPIFHEIYLLGQYIYTRYIKRKITPLSPDPVA